MRLRILAAFAVASLPVLSAAQTPTPSPSPTPSATDAELLEKVEGELGTGVTAPAAATPGTSTALTTSNIYNPAISVNGLLRGSYSSFDPPEPPPGEEPEGVTQTGMGIQEVELQFISNVDPYFKANLIAAMEGGEGIEIEEGYLQPFWQPVGFSFRVGKLKGAFGRENWKHTHALPFVDRSLILPAVFGGEGFGEFGVEASWLAPTPWYLLFTAQALDGENEFFASERGDDLVYLGAMSSLFDLNDDTTLEVGGSGTWGNDANGTAASTAGGHVYVKWRPARYATTRGLTLVGEWLYANKKNPDPDPGLPRSFNVGGGYGFLEARVSRRFYLAGRFDYLGEPEEDSGVTTRISAIVAFAPTEFSAIRIQGSETRPPFGEDPIQEAFLQLNFTLGAHPAHTY